MKIRISHAGSLVAALATLSLLVGPPSVQAGLECVGDCSGDQMVSVADIDFAIHILFDQDLYAECPAFPQPVTVAGLLQAIQSRADNCGNPVGPTSTPTPTPTPTVAAPTPTATTGEVPPAVAGRTTIVVNAMGVIPNVVAAIVGGLEFGGASSVSAGIPTGGAAGACPLGGTATRTGSLPFVSITLTQCKVATGDGSATFNGTASINFNTFNVNITAIFNDMNGDETRRASAMVNGTVAPTFGGACQFTAATLTVATGTLTVQTPDLVQVGVTFMNTQVVFNDITFNQDCVPEKYRMTFNGNAALLTPDGMPSTVSFSNFIMNVDDSGDPTTFDLSGNMSSTCFGGAVSVTTPTLLAVPDGELCPTAGVLEVDGAASTAVITYGAGGTVTIDQSGMQEDYPNCLDPRLLMCLA